MFNLEQSIANWRTQMLAAGIREPAPLEELESHLREEIERQLKSGLNEPDAFHHAVHKIGRAGVLKREFQKANPLTLLMGQMLLIGLGFVTAGVGLFQISVLIEQSRNLGNISSDGFLLVAMFVVAFILALALFGLGLALIFGRHTRNGHPAPIRYV